MKTAGFHGKKGFQWEAIPDKLPALDQEISKFLAEEGKTPQQFGIESLCTKQFRCKFSYVSSSWSVLYVILFYFL